MKKSDLILAQKTLAAKQVKMESQMIQKELAMMKSGMSPSPARSLSSSQSRSRLSMSMSALPSSPGGGGFGASSSFSALPELSSTSEKRVSASRQGAPRPALSQHNEDLVNELSQRTLTDATMMRKKQIDVGREVRERENAAALAATRGSSAVPGPRSNSNQMDASVAREAMGSRMGSSAARNMFANDRRPMTTNSSSSRQGFYDQTNSQANYQASTGNLATIQEANGGAQEIGENFFMPKKTILRPDGASLLDIYKSKKGDTWGKIIRAQYKEELEMNEIKRLEKERANEEYGIKLKEQLAERARAKEKGSVEDTMFAALEDATAKRTEDLQRSREQAAINNHKRFIANALEDIAIKRKNHEEFLRQELTASTVMVSNAKKLMALDALKKDKERENAKQYQEQMYQENLYNIERKQKMKLDSFSEDKRINREREEQYRRDDQRKKDENEQRLKQSSEGPAHHIVEKIAVMKKKKDDALYDEIFRQENNLNKQLKASEDAAKARAAANGDSLTEEWIKNTEFKMKKKREDDERNAKIIATMHQMIRDQEEEDLRNREKKHEAAMRYQRELDAQLNDLRQRSISTLKKTMSEEEAKYNKKLIQTTSKYVDYGDSV